VTRQLTAMCCKSCGAVLGAIDNAWTRDLQHEIGALRADLTEIKNTLASMAP